MSEINIYDLYNNINKKKYEKYVVYDKILKRCHTKIKTYADNLKLNCIYEIPVFIFGIPLYNIFYVKNYIIKRLTENGFIVKDLPGNYIYISWDLEKSNKKSSKKISSNNKYRQISDYSPGGQFIHNESGLDSIKAKTHLLDGPFRLIS